jgi:pimeloyl-ACP methyl ester carboxylesterase
VAAPDSNPVAPAWLLHLHEARVTVPPRIGLRRPAEYTRFLSARYASTDGVRVAYDDLGAGEPALLFMTGWCSNRRRWSRVAKLCDRHLRVLNTEWRGHGESDPAPADFGLEEMVADMLAVVDKADVDRFVPCAASHSGFVAIELRRRFPERVPKLVHADWYVIPPPPPYRAVLEQLTSPETWAEARDKLCEIWRAGSESPQVAALLDEMRGQGADMWVRSGREIAAGYERVGSPADAWAELDPPAEVLHLYGQPQDPTFLTAQEEYAARHRWFTVRKLECLTHFAMIELPEQVAETIEAFVAATG